MRRYELGCESRACFGENGNLLAHLKLYPDHGNQISLSFDHYVLTVGEFDRIATWFAHCNEEVLPHPDDQANRSL